ncbi:hypothetical protein LEP1GSC087_2593 [Leptospira interrogans serovar Bataviae str. L1111]|nr:hypothetical protein LEP1GSC087_2593 [Leptospira interrogans serovar Bataviae str. L1111]
MESEFYKIDSLNVGTPTKLKFFFVKWMKLQQIMILQIILKL